MPPAELLNVSVDPLRTYCARRGLGDRVAHSADMPDGEHRERTSRLLALWERPHNLWGWFATVDHKEIGKRYLITAFIFLLLGGIEALMLRTQLARPNAGVLTPEQYDQIFTMHGVTMIFWYALPILSGFGNYLIPLMGGMRDMAYP